MPHCYTPPIDNDVLIAGSYEMVGRGELDLDSGWNGPLLRILWIHVWMA